VRFSLKHVSIRNKIAFAPALLVAFSVGLHAQNSLIKPGLWHSEVTTSTTLALPADVEARIGALPPDRQQVVRAQMGAGKSTTIVNRSCIAPNTTFDSFLKDQTQRNSRLKCSVTNRTVSQSGGSFDTECSGKGTTATAHVDFTRTDEEHASGKMNMTMTSNRDGRRFSGTSESTIHYKYVGPNCGNVKTLRKLGSSQ